jgi:hypothetical protein
MNATTMWSAERYVHITAMISTETLLTNPQHSAVNYQASQVYGLHMQGPKEKIRCKALHTKFGHPRQRRVSSQGGLYSMRGKDGSGDKPKPKPQPIDPGKKPYGDEMIRRTLIFRRPRPIDVCIDVGCFEDEVDSDLRQWKRVLPSACCSIMELSVYCPRYCEVPL